jgi:pimeloyl-ACP methyl ester carboxylesterase
MDPQPPHLSSAYCPHGTTGNLVSLGFREESNETEFGSVHTYVRRSDGSRNVTLMVHGVAADATTWAPMIQCADEFGIDLGNIAAIDMPGFGRSENNKETLWIPEIAALYIELLERMGFDSVRLFGHSMGGFLCLDMAANCEQVTSVHVAAGSYFGILNTIKRPLRNIPTNPRTALLWNGYWALSHTNDFGYRANKMLAQLGMARTIAGAFFAQPRQLEEEDVRKLVLRLNPQGVIRTARNGPDYNAERTWGSITVPLTAVFGQHDPLVTSWDASELKRVNPTATIRYVDASHMLIVERPIDTLRAMLRLDA